MADPQLHHGQHQQDGEHHPRQRGGIAEFKERERMLEQHDPQDVGRRFRAATGAVENIDHVKRLKSVDDRDDDTNDIDPRINGTVMETNCLISLAPSILAAS